MLVLYGGNGFIGRHLSIFIQAAGLQSVIVSRAPDLDFCRRYAPSAVSMPVSEFESAAGEALLRERATAFIYLASSSVPGSNIDEPWREIPLNVMPAFQTFSRIARLRPDLPIVFLSSGGTVYGRSDEERIPETAPLRPISPYGLGKVLIEQCLRYCGDTANQRYAILRASNAIGRWHRNPKQGIVMAVLRAINTNTPLQIYGDGSAVRDYIDADDIAEAIVAIAARPKTGVWNIAAGEGHSILEIIDMVEQVIGKRPAVDFRPARAVDVPRVVLDPTKAKNDFAWKAKTPLQESLRKALA